MTTAADELRAAAEKLRTATFRGAITATPAVAALIGAREPIAEWLEHEARAARDAHLYTDREPCAWCGEPANAHALAIARQINGGQP